MQNLKLQETLEHDLKTREMEIQLELSEIKEKMKENKGKNADKIERIRTIKDQMMKITADIG